MSNPVRPAPTEPASVPRFSAAVRAVHWTTAVVMGSCLVTAAILYNAPLAIPIGHRRIVELIHVYSGFALPVPMVAGLAFRAYRQDLRRLNRFTGSDWQWLRSRTRRDGVIAVGKFNAGQKLNASLTAGSILVLLGTGLVMFFPGWSPVAWRSGATFVHDWFALALGVLIIGHLRFALNDAEARRGMLTGVVGARWARAEHGAWADEIGIPRERSEDPDD